MFGCDRRRRTQVSDIPFRTPSIIAVRSFILIGLVIYSSTPAFDARALASELVTPVRAAMWTLRDFRLRSTARICSVASKPSMIYEFIVNIDQSRRRREGQTNRHVHVHENKEVGGRGDSILLQRLKAVDSAFAIQS
jgi:hypothetical protein